MTPRSHERAPTRVTWSIAASARSPLPDGRIPHRFQHARHPYQRSRTLRHRKNPLRQRERGDQRQRTQLFSLFRNVDAERDRHIPLFRIVVVVRWGRCARNVHSTRSTRSGRWDPLAARAREHVVPAEAAMFVRVPEIPCTISIVDETSKFCSVGMERSATSTERSGRRSVENGTTVLYYRTFPVPFDLPLAICEQGGAG